MFWLNLYRNGYKCRIEVQDDSKLQEVMDICAKHFCEPGKVLEIPAVLPQPKEKKRAKR